jgi:hypothetical protein
MAVATVPTTLDRVMSANPTEATLALVASEFDLPREMVNRIVAAGLPLMASEADGNPYVFKAMFAQSRKAVAEPTPAFYKKLGKDAKAQQTVAAEFRAIYGAMTDTLNREAGRRSDVSEEQAGRVLSAAMPAMIQAMAEENTQRNEMGFGRLLRNLNR